MPEWSVALLAMFLATVAGLIALLTIVFLVEVLTAVLCVPRTRLPQSANSARPRVSVLVPAHNEGRNLLPTLADIKSQLTDDDRLLVVADNCSDDTAAVASHASAEVVERRDSTKLGKGFALDCGIRYLRRDPPSIVVVIDADCRLSSDTLDQLVRTTSVTGRPAQALYLMTAPTGSAINYQVAEFAWRVKNWVRPLGLYALNLPCQLVGTGMAFPWEVFLSTNLATGHLVEDLKLGLDLAATGYAPVFCPTAIVKSTFPPTLRGAVKQRERWEHGHVGLSLKTAPALIGQALVTGNIGLLALALDIVVPPLTLLFYLNIGTLLLATLAVLFGLPSLGLYLSIMSSSTFLVGVFLAWMSHGRDVLPASSVMHVGSYIFAKLGLYWRLLLRGPISQWSRTDRK
jgi:cellulose synthase/poly-beta-1,6-N-acetylglucosamine synthase-like glycosyltransferase